MLTPAQQAAFDEINQEIGSAPSDTNNISTVVEDPNAAYRLLILPLVQTLSIVICPNWSLTTDEQTQIVESFVPVVRKYLPDVDNLQLPPEVLALVTVSMIALPRIAQRKPMRVVVEEEPEKTEKAA
jgi:hypothetical protein